MSVKWALKRSLNMFPDWPTYCRPHFEHESRYTTFFDLQLYRPWMGILCFVIQHTIDVVCFIKGHVLRGMLQGPEPFLMRIGLMSVLTRSYLIFMALLFTTRNLLSLSCLSSPEEDRMCLLVFGILSTGGLYVIMKGIRLVGS